METRLGNWSRVEVRGIMHCLWEQKVSSSAYRRCNFPPWPVLTAHGIAGLRTHYKISVGKRRTFSHTVPIRTQRFSSVSRLKRTLNGTRFCMRWRRQAFYHHVTDATVAYLHSMCLGWKEFITLFDSCHNLSNGLRWKAQRTGDAFIVYCLFHLLKSYDWALLISNFDVWLTVHRSSMWIKRPTRCHF